MLSVEGDAPAPPPGVPIEKETFDRQIKDAGTIHERPINADPVNDGPTEPAGVLPPQQRHDDTHDLQSRIEAKVQEAQFYMSQQMWDSAKKAVLDLAEFAPDAPEINELMARGERRAIQACDESAGHGGICGFDLLSRRRWIILPPPFSVPVPQVSIPDHPT